MWIQETLPVDVVDEAVFRALNWFLPTYFNIRREEVQQSVIYEISNKQGEMWGQYWIFPGSSGKAIHLMNWISNNFEAKKGFLMVIDDVIRELLRERISFGSLVPQEVFQVTLYLAVDGQYGKDLPIELVSESLDSNAELIANVVDRLDKSGLVEFTTEDHICLTSEGVEETLKLIEKNLSTKDPLTIKSDDEEKMWEKIPDVLWYRRAVEMLWKEYSSPEIARSLDLSDHTVDNKLSDLRKLFPDHVPTRDKLRQLRISRKI